MEKKVETRSIVIFPTYKIRYSLWSKLGLLYCAVVQMNTIEMIYGAYINSRMFPIIIYILKEVELKP